MRDLTREHDAEFFVGFQAPNEALQQELDRLGVQWIDLNGAERFPSYGEHWTPSGHAAVATRISEFLAGADWAGGTKQP